jgi:hypothetical protein
VCKPKTCHGDSITNPGGTQFGNELQKVLFETVTTHSLHAYAATLLMLVNLVHAPGANWLENLVWAEPCAARARDWP